MESKRFKPMKRHHFDGRSWWCVFDTEKGDYSKIVFFGKYKTKKACQAWIDTYCEKYKELNS